MTTYYIQENAEEYVVAYGFRTAEDAEHYIYTGPYLKDYPWKYEVIKCEYDWIYGVTYERDSCENGGTIWIPFATWDEAVDWVVETMSHPVCFLPDDFDYDIDIFQVDMTQKGY